ncbi:MAG: NmrA/HSCARG family protein [Acidobacteria bacterium]|nr:MAG: NmrA/HSCARG family protein [Acidobacteriota bacterium]
MQSTIVVCGATGNQGRAVVRHLLARRRWDVVAMTRAPDSTRAVEAARAGARVVRGDLLDRESLRDAFRGAHGVFGVTQPWSPDYKTCDVAGEIRQGRNLIDACVDAGVEHLVLSTVLPVATAPTGVPHVDSKVEIEKYAREMHVPMTVIRPASFMDNIGTRFFPVKPGRVRGFVARDAKVPYIACADIGGLVSVAFVRSDQLRGSEINAVGDFVSGDEIAAILARIHGAPFRYTVPPAFLMWLFAREFYTMRRSFERYGRAPYPPEVSAYIDQTRRLWPETMTLERFLRQPDRGFTVA